MATLTGACIVALGTQIAGLFTPSDDMAAALTAASKAAGGWRSVLGCGRERWGGEMGWGDGGGRWRGEMGWGGGGGGRCGGG